MLPDRAEGVPHPADTRRLVGQATAEAAVRDAWASGRLAHGWLLAGPEGIGKATLAYRMARAAIAGDGRLEAPEDCPVAARIRAGSEPGLRVLRREVDTESRSTPKPVQTRIPIRNVRKAKEFLQTSAPDGGWRAVIVDAADELTLQAANAFLKLLEEPPARTLLLLVAHNAGGLLPTIRSRCRRLDLRPLGPGDLSAALAQAGHDLPPAEAEALAGLSGGSVGRAARLIASDGLGIYAELVAAVGERDLDRAAAHRVASVGAGREGRARAELRVELALLLLARLARAAVTGPPETEAAPGEARLMRAAAGQGAVWAEARARLGARAGQALAVNLDPGQVILDMLLDIDATRAAAR